MSLLVEKPGLLSTIQDIGRHGFSGWGVNVNGCMDAYASQVANALVGNAHNAPVIEMHFPAAEILFEKQCLISITGADFQASIDGQRIPLWKPVWVTPGAKLKFQRKLNGNRCYLGVSGGFDLAPWLGSYSTNLKVNVGGHEGRALQKGDRILLKRPASAISNITPGKINVLPWTVNHHQVYHDVDIIRFIPGPEWDWLAASSRQLILSSTFSISGASDRMATALIHEPLHLENEMELVSTAVAFGTIQILPTGRLIVLMADHQTTGGYPRAGSVISSDLPKFAQLDFGAAFTFAQTSIADAEKMLISLQQQLRKLSESCLQKLQQLNAEY